MTDDIVIRVEGVSKKFRLHRGGSRTLKSAVLDRFRRRSGQGRDFFALTDVTFTVRQGEVLGIVGANGAGKSTLLAIMAGTMEPTTGAVTARGRISSLLELGAGFHPDLTGEENVYLYGAIMGLSREWMQKRFDAIVDFADLRQFIDQPVKHYSSGMYVRLGFSVAVEVDPDILLVDEVLAVGDASFRRRCLQRMEDFRRQRKTMVMISHDLDTIQSVSDRILFLDQGKVIEDGDPRDVVKKYEAHMRRKDAQTGMGREWGTREVQITRVEFIDGAGRETNRFVSGDALRVRLHYQASARVADPVFGFGVSTDTGVLVTGNNTQIETFPIPFIEGAGAIDLTIAPLLLAKGVYLFSFSVHSADHQVNFHRLDQCFPVYVDADKRFEGVCYLPCRWARVGDPVQL